MRVSKRQRFVRGIKALAVLPLIVGFVILWIIIDMIRKTAKGYVVKSKSGKNLGGPYKTRAEAVKRLRQVEHFKRKG